MHESDFIALRVSDFLYVQILNVFFFYFDSVKPTVMEMPRVRIPSESYDTPIRQFSKGTVIQITCEGQIGSDPSTVCINTITNIH